jgi:hypothetical protein
MITTTNTDFEPQKEQSDVNVSEFLKEHQEIEMIVPVMVGLFVTSRFQFRGANALLVNLGVASLFRQIFRQLKETPSSTTQSVPLSRPHDSSLLGEGVKILHSVPDRLRLRIDQVAVDADFAQRLEKLLLEEQCVTGVRINPTVASVVINYDSGELSELDLGLKLISIINSARQEA